MLVTKLKRSLREYKFINEDYHKQIEVLKRNIKSTKLDEKEAEIALMIEQYNFVLAKYQHMQRKHNQTKLEFERACEDISKKKKKIKLLKKQNDSLDERMATQYTSLEQTKVDVQYWKQKYEKLQKRSQLQENSVNQQNSYAIMEIENDMASTENLNKDISDSKTSGVLGNKVKLLEQQLSQQMDENLELNRAVQDIKKKYDDSVHDLKRIQA